MTDELNFELETEYGLTDITQEYLYKGTRFQLQFLEIHDAIMLNVLNEDNIPLWLLETARCLVKLCKEKKDNKRNDKSGEYLSAEDRDKNS
ncbi:MAG: hypothetical protein IK955_07880 [Clostridia bacterium]|nr:hypothetical protein [Clostridia bacterium]